jgi:protein involved in polysaccharide export with SLBB domain
MKILIFIVLTILVSAITAFCQETFSERDPRYRIQPSDVVEVQYRYTPEYNHVVTVQPDGFAALQFVGDVKIAGLTVEEAAAAIAEKAGERLQKPEVTVTLKEFIKPYFTVAGEVNHPGRFDLRGRVSAIEGIAMSGGFKDTSKRTTVILLRQASTDMAEVKVLDLKRLMSARSIAEDATLRSGDLLVVPQNKISRVEPFMRVGQTGLYGLGLALRGY